MKKFKRVFRSPRKVLFVVLMILLIPFLCEFALQLVWLVFPEPVTRQKTMKGKPGYDRLGYRNKDVPEQAKLVALGDSQTQGAGVQRKYAWPQQFERITGWTTYNMGLGGRGPVESLDSLEVAFDRKPEVIVEAFYAGNDPKDAFGYVYGRNHHAELKTTDVSVRENIQQELESIDFGARTKREMAKIGWNVPTGLRLFLDRHSKLYFLWRLFRAETAHLFRSEDDEQTDDEKAKKVKAKKKEDPEAIWKRSLAYAEKHKGVVPCQHPEMRYRTLFTSDYRLCALDRSYAIIREGMALCRRVLARMNERVREKEKVFLVVLIPTKEYAWAPFVEDAGLKVGESYEKLVRDEGIMWRQTKQFLDRKGIPYLDAADALREAARSGTFPYGMGINGHPEASGQEAIARGVKEKLAEMGLFEN